MEYPIVGSIHLGGRHIIVPGAVWLFGVVDNVFVPCALCLVLVAWMMTVAMRERPLWSIWSLKSEVLWNYQKDLFCTD